MPNFINADSQAEACAGNLRATAHLAHSSSAWSWLATCKVNPVGYADCTYRLPVARAVGSTALIGYAPVARTGSRAAAAANSCLSVFLSPNSDKPTGAVPGS